jgi:hypothetical protein
MSSRRDFLTTLGAGFAGAAALRAQGQTPPPAPRGGSRILGEGARTGRGAEPVQVLKVKTTPLFKSPEGYPNGIAVAPEGLWICEQVSNHAVLVDWKGKLLKTIPTEAKNASGIGYGDGYVWMCANSGQAEGIFQTDMNGKTVSHRQIPLGLPDNGGGCHGAAYVNGKMYIAALRLKGILRVDVKTWTPEFLIPYSVNRAHGIAYNDKDNSIWMVSGNPADSSQTAGSMGLTKYDAATGRVLATVAFTKEDCDPHGLAWYNGELYSCDAGVHPGWPDDISPTHGQIFKIDFVA